MTLRGFTLACSDATEQECLDRELFAADREYRPVFHRIREGDLLFLFNLSSDVLWGVFRATSDGGYSLEPEAFGGRYPCQVKVSCVGRPQALPMGSKTLSELLDNGKNGSWKRYRNRPLSGKRLAALLQEYSALEAQQMPMVFQGPGVAEPAPAYGGLIAQAVAPKGTPDIEEEIPVLESTTLWDFPKQSYGPTPKGSNKYAGVTPALIIYNMIWRYTQPGDLVVDPMCGSGTTIDVCKTEGRRVIGYDIGSTREDIIQNDARHIPLEDASVDMMFIDSPYGDNIKYNEHPDNIGHLTAEGNEFYDALDMVMSEAHRVLKEGKVLGWLIGDQWVKHKYTPVGFHIYERLCKYFEPVDLICVTRRSQSSNTGIWHDRARRFNFYLRGFKHLIIVRKPLQTPSKRNRGKVEWARYER